MTPVLFPLSSAADFVTVLIPLVLVILFVIRLEGNQRVLASRLNGLEEWMAKLDEKLDQVLLSIAFPARARGGKKDD